MPRLTMRRRRKPHHILYEIADIVEQEPLWHSGKKNRVYDSNGNAVGTWEYIPDDAKSKANPAPILAVVLEGGVVQCITSDQPEAFAGVKVLTIDYDTEGGDNDRLSLVRQSDGEEVEAFVNEEFVTKAEIDLENIRLPVAEIEEAQED